MWHSHYESRKRAPPHVYFESRPEREQNKYELRSEMPLCLLTWLASQAATSGWLFQRTAVGTACRLKILEHVHKQSQNLQAKQCALSRCLKAVTRIDEQPKIFCDRELLENKASLIYLIFSNSLMFSHCEIIIQI